MPLDEVSLRLPTFDESTSHPVAFGAAGTFWLPKPHVRTRYRFKAGKIDGRTVATDDPDFNALVSAIEEHWAYSDIAQMAAWLLMRNYALSDDQLSEILEFDPSTETADDWPAKVMDVVYGRTGPKA